MSKYQPKKIKFDRKAIHKAEKSIDIQSLVGDEGYIKGEISAKVETAIRAISSCIYRDDYEALQEIGKVMKAFATEKWSGYVSPTVLTTEEHEYLLQQFNVEIEFHERTLDFDVKISNVEFSKESRHKLIRYYAFTHCSYLDGYNDPMTSEYFDPEDTVAARKELDALIVKIKNDVQNNVDYVKKQQERYANLNV